MYYTVILQEITLERQESLYIIAMREEIIIEVRNSEIQKLILAMFRFMQDHSKKIDVNALLRMLIKKADAEKSGTP